MTKTPPCINHEEAHEFFTIREIEEIIRNRGWKYVLSKMEPMTQKIILSSDIQFSQPKDVPHLCKKCS